MLLVPLIPLRNEEDLALDLEGVRRYGGVVKVTGGTYIVYNSYALGGTPNEKRRKSVPHPIGRRETCIS